MAVSHLLADLAIEHNGQADELTWSWDGGIDELTLGGFKRLYGTLTWVRVRYWFADTPDVEHTAYVTVPRQWDIHDVRTAILAVLTDASIDVEVIEETLATVSGSATLTLDYVDYADDPPSISVVEDGGVGAVVVASPATYSVPLASMSGIFGARGRLGAWDRENAIARSAFADPFDFTPSLETQASIGRSQAVTGDIVHIAGVSDGYIVYSTSNIVQAYYSGDDYVFKYRVAATVGCSDPRHVHGSGDTHLVYTSAGLKFINAPSGQPAQMQDMPAEVDAFLGAYQWPLSVQLLSDRYVCLGLPYLAARDALLLRNRGLASSHVTGPTTQPPAESALVANYTYDWAHNATYERTLLFDTKLGKWGSCDVPVALLWDAVPLNAKGINIGRLTYGADQAWQHEGAVLGMLLPGREVCIATPFSEGRVFIGWPKTSGQGMSTLLSVEVANSPGFPVSWGVTVEQYARDEWRLDQVELLAGIDSLQYHIPCRLNAAYFGIALTGVFNANLLRAQMLPQGRF